MNILVIDDHALLREVIGNICEETGRARQIVFAVDGVSAIRRLSDQHFAVVIMEWCLPDLDGFAVVRAVYALAPAARVLVATSLCNVYSVYHAEKNHVRGFVDYRTATKSELKHAIARVADGGIHFCANYLRLKGLRINNPYSFDKILSDRELSVLTLIATPYTDQEIGNKLGISSETVEKHRFNILRKLDLGSTIELMRFARTIGIRPPRDQISPEVSYRKVSDVSPDSATLGR